jgi:hypothetical protein
MGRLRQSQPGTQFYLLSAGTGTPGSAFDFSALLVVKLSSLAHLDLRDTLYPKVSRRTPQPWVSDTTQQHVPRLALSRLCFMLLPPPFAVLAPILDDGTHYEIG